LGVGVGGMRRWAVVRTEVRSAGALWRPRAFSTESECAPESAAARACSSSAAAVAHSNGHGGRFRRPLEVTKVGVDVLHDPLINKGTGFCMDERERLRIRGLVPTRMLSMEQQAAKLLGRYDKLSTDLDKHAYLQDLRDRNEVLYFRILMDNIKKLSPIIYTPTVGEACQKFGMMFRRARGMYFSLHDRGFMGSMMYNWPESEVDVIVVTDGSRILGLGDLGVNGMGIPIGKLALYVAAGGIHPSRVMPVMLDVGTNNLALQKDPNYLGIQEPRLRGPEYLRFVDEFMMAVKHRFPNAMVQFEDFETAVAAPILAKYKDSMRCFNDDIQGTGAVALAGLLTALRVQGKPPSALVDERIVCLGAGSAGIGVISSIHNGMVQEGLSPDDAYSHFWIIDEKGLLTQNRTNMFRTQVPYARMDEDQNLSLLDVIRKVKPTVLFGLSGAYNTFTKEIVEEMCKHVERPIIFPLSNPTSRAECTAHDAIHWSHGRAIVATGSPFGSVEYGGRSIEVGQSNNMFIFPGIGLAHVVCRPSVITEEMFYVAARALAQSMTQDELDRGLCFPCISRIREVSRSIAVEVCKLAYDRKLATIDDPRRLGGVHRLVESHMFEPEYAELVHIHN
jgi:malate dehydrogenase (oxaloacetate-decarboxylating)(NADP+)